MLLLVIPLSISTGIDLGCAIAESIGGSDLEEYSHYVLVLRAVKVDVGALIATAIFQIVLSFLTGVCPDQVFSFKKADSFHSAGRIWWIHRISKKFSNPKVQKRYSLALSLV